MDGSILESTIRTTGRDLRKALTAFRPIAGGRRPIPVLGMALIPAGRRCIVATDLDQQLTMPLTGEGSLASDLLLPVDAALRLSVTFAPTEAVALGQSPERVVKREVVEKSTGNVIPAITAHGVALSYDDGSASFSGLPPGDLPLIDFPEQPRARFDVDAHALAAALARVRPCISTEETRYYLNGVDMVTLDLPEGRVLRLTATDGHRLGYRLLRGIPDLPAIESSIIPHAAVRTLLAMLAGNTGPLRVEISGDKPRARFTIGEYQLVTKLIDGTYPDITRVIPSDESRIVLSLPRLATVAAVRRCAAVAGSGRGASAIRAEAQNGILTFTARTPEDDSISCRVCVNADLPDAFGFNAGYMLDALTALDGPTVSMDLHEIDRSSPIRFVEPDQEAAGLFLIMPMRV